ncbi:signal peptidase I [Cohnella rhizosphaerae]|uniref:Signal peptidase I n=1 Tax=Cohnella rhizosphaerae TaxID=1457232 RepID=A0A9X4KQH0_9BACL|nr:signal peptidase I [Cohnella rhizosphaerae]MDG0809010.1 signal peptidase I [Cohnella rhizosphaerae]
MKRGSETVKKWMCVLLLMLAATLAECTSPLSLKSYVADGNSMSPTLNDGDRMLVSTDLSEKIKADDLLIIKVSGKEYCKRVIGVAGDRIEAKEAGVYVNDRLLYKTDFMPENAIKPAIVLGEDEYYMLGDNIDNSLDSRMYGPIRSDQVIGRVTKIIPKK